MTYLPAATDPGDTMTSTLSNSDDSKYILNTKIMVVALAVLFAVVFFVICLHIYAKWAWSTRVPASVSFWPSRWRRRSASPILLDSEMLDINMVVGLGKAEVEALPTFQYKSDIEVGALECSICLGQFQEGELGRTLPKCNHQFHLKCIDMWLYSHSTCPLCRDVLKPEEDDTAALNMAESASVQVFRTERVGPPRRLRGMEPGDQDILQQRDEGEESEGEDHSEQETANKRADGIPANVLFWGNLMQQQGAEFRIVNNAPQQAQAPPQTAIDRERGSPRMRNHGVSVNSISHAAGSL